MTALWLRIWLVRDEDDSNNNDDDGDFYDHHHNHDHDHNHRQAENSHLPPRPVRWSWAVRALSTVPTCSFD